ncbi:AzlD domain-containing protein [Scandinavium manionii]|uniref:AzlD domain-containing protein n=1 Tax=Scandinavium manionii TaxID=2926520 RepID=UPI00135C6AC9|nr:AzlD domain-containing protein [Scandinavium manionii]MCS2166283.1 AzlD domain-containing protein [Scandinavium manionii]
MSWILILALAAIVFFNRYVFLEPNVPLKIPGIINKALKYSAPCLLTAICGPIILMDHGVVRAFPLNPYFVAAIFSIIISLVIRNIVSAVLLSLAIFYGITYFLQ